MQETADSAIQEKDYNKAEIYMKMIINVGRMMNNNPELASTTLIFLYSIQRTTLEKMARLYEEIGNQEKLKQVQDNLQSVITERKSIIDKNII